MAAREGQGDKRVSLREEILNYVETNLTLHIEPYHADEIINKVLDAAIEAANKQRIPPADKPYPAYWYNGAIDEVERSIQALKNPAPERDGV